MKHSDILSKNGIIFNMITDIMAKAELNTKEDINNPLVKTDILVICNDNEIFDEAMTTLMNRYPQATGLVLKPNPGIKMGARFTTVSARIAHKGITINVDVMTVEEYTKNKAAVDAKTYNSKEKIMWTGGEN